MSMVSTWRMIRCAVFGSVLSCVICRACANLCCAVGFFTALAVHMRSNNGASDSARTITCSGTGADRRVCMLATRDAPICVVIVTAWVKIVSPPKVA